MIPTANNPEGLRAASDTLLALSLWAPWNVAIERHGKRTENRNGWTPYPGLITRARNLIGRRIALHSSAKWDQDGAQYIAECTGKVYTPSIVPMKAITSVATLAGLLKPGDACPVGQEIWYDGGTALVLTDVQVLRRPVPCSGSQGFWVVPSDVQARVEGQL